MRPSLEVPYYKIIILAYCDEARVGAVDSHGNHLRGVANISHSIGEQLTMTGMQLILIRRMRMSTTLKGGYLGLEMRMSLSLTH